MRRQLTGTAGAQNDKQLVIYGSVAGDAELNGVGKVSSQRDLGVGNSSPGVAFIWNPFLILNAPQPFTDAVMPAPSERHHDAWM